MSHLHKFWKNHWKHEGVGAGMADSLLIPFCPYGKHTNFHGIGGNSMRTTIGLPEGMLYLQKRRMPRKTNTAPTEEPPATCKNLFMQVKINKSPQSNPAGIGCRWIQASQEHPEPSCWSRSMTSKKGLTQQNMAKESWCLHRHFSLYLRPLKESDLWTRAFGLHGNCA